MVLTVYMIIIHGMCPDCKKQGQPFPAAPHEIVFTVSMDIKDNRPITG